MPRLIRYAALAVLLTSAAAAVYILRGNPLDPLDRGREPVSDDYLGMSKAAFVGTYGPPSHQWEGHYGNPRLDYVQQHPGTVSLTYERWTGTLYLSFEEVDGEWRCFSSDWMPDGWVLD
jgi:hypothetical protein